MNGRSGHEVHSWDYGGVSPAAWAALSLTLKANLARRVTAGSKRPRKLLDWGRRFLPHYFRYRPSAMHVWLANQLDAMTNRRGTKVNVIGPRGGAKSTLGTLAYALRAAVEGWEPYIWIVSDTKDQARSHLENLKLELLGNQDLAAVYPQACGRGDPWRGNSIRLPNGVAIESFGTGQRIRGRRNRDHRPTLIVCDDLQNDSHMRSPSAREASQLWFTGSLLKAGTPSTNLVNLATALHRDALALKLARTPGWRSRTFRSIERWPTAMSLWHEWERIYCDFTGEAGPAAARAFYEAKSDALNAGAEVLWPEHEDLYTLMQMRVEGGHAAFEREKQGAPLSADACEWPDEYFDERIWFEAWPQHLRLRVIALDPSKGRDARRGDFSAYVRLGVDTDGLLWVEADLARCATPEMVAHGVELCRTFQPQALGVETNQFQELLAGEFQQALCEQGLVDVPIWNIDNRVNKQIRVRRLGPYLASRRIRFRDTASTRLLVDQLREFPSGAHDDGPDALEMALRLAGELLGGNDSRDALGDRLPLAVP